MSIPFAYVGLIALWSTTPLAVKWSTEGGGYLFGVTGRMLLAFIVCMIVSLILRVTWPVHRRALMVYLLGGVNIYVSMFAVYWGAQFIPSGLIAVLFGLTPLATGLFAAIWLQEQAFTPAKLIGLVSALGGLYVIFGGEHVSAQALIGMASVLVAVLWHSASTVLTKRLAGDLPIFALTTAGIGVSVPMFYLSWVLTGGSWPAALPQHTVGAIVYLGVIGSALGFALYFYVLKNIEASRVALIPLMTPVCALLIGLAFNHEHPQARVWLGALLIVGGLAFYELGGRAVRSYRRRIATSKAI